MLGYIIYDPLDPRKHGQFSAHRTASGPCYFVSVDAKKAELLITMPACYSILGHFQADGASHKELEEGGFVGNLYGAVLASA